MPLRLLLISHPATAAMRKGYLPADDPLDARAIAAIAEQRVHLPLADAADVFCSPEICTRQTAETLGLQATVANPLAEVDYGRWRGQALSQIAAEEPDALADWLQHPESAVHGGESVVQLCSRVGAWLDDLPQQDSVVAITHASIIRAAITHALMAPPSAFTRIEIPPLALIRLQKSHKGWHWWPAMS